MVISIIALGLEIQSRFSFTQAVQKVVEARESAYCKNLTAKMNKGRELMGLPAISPTTFAAVLEAYFESMASVMDQGVANKLEAQKPAGK
jgi:hypothetical protein